MNKRTLSILHGSYFAIGGIWPIFHMRSFEAVTGKKVDKWLVKTVGLLLTATGAGLLLSARKSAPSKELVYVAAGQSLALAAICAYYGGIRHRISRIYLADAVAELVLVILWTRSRPFRMAPSTVPDLSSAKASPAK
jgi:hypothetical protein